ncbi:MAG: MarR family winged helix-turn-helix transcriptional regulator [Minwuia sp.]|uniref:MarR family winged helix-turn-helix transcriptional regulator n=1 Tax=Minwuia sp. TaxID=2493630 RepID=UPI003A85FBA2
MDTARPPAIRLDDYLPYLVNRIGPPVEDGFGPPLHRAGITLPMWRVIAVVLNDGPQRLNDLAARISLPASSASRLVSEMVAEGHLSRVRNDRDGRAVHVDLTEPGRIIAGGVARAAAQYEDHITRNFTAAETAELKRLLKKLHGALADADAIWDGATEETSHG